MSSLPSFNGERILVTGASGSIGQATAKHLARAGAKVVLSGRDAAKLEKLAAELSGAVVAAYDLTQPDNIPAWMLGLAERGGPFAGIAHAAGIHATKALRMSDAAFIDAMFAMNVTSGIMLGKGLRQKACHIDGAAMVFLGSTSAYTNGAGMAVYATSKGAVVGATKALAHELLRDKIRVNCVSPALVDTPMTDRAGRSVPAEGWKSVVDKHLLGIGTVDDVAQAIVYLLSNQTRWMTGAELIIDGGYGLT